MNQLISVIIPVYNVRDYLDECLNSVINQTYSNLEILLVDDGSDDGSTDICKKYSEKDLRIKLIIQSNNGQSSARNVALKIARGDYISFVDSDDYIDIKMYEILINNINETDSDIVICDFCRLYKDEIIKSMMSIDNLNCNKKYALNLLLDNQSLCSPCGKLFKKEMFNNIIFPIGMIYEDLAIMPKIFFNAENFSFIKNSLYYYRCREDSTIQKEFTLKNLDRVKALEMRCDFYKKNCYDLYNKAYVKYIGGLSLAVANLNYIDEQYARKIQEKYFTIIKKNIFWVFGVRGLSKREFIYCLSIKLNIKLFEVVLYFFNKLTGKV